LLALNGCLAIVASIVISALRPYEQERLEIQGEQDEKDKINKPDADKSIESSLQHPLARLLLCSSFLIIFNRYLIDFLFAAAISSFFSSGKALASFMGVFGAAADLLVIGLQTFVMKTVFSSLPVGRVLTFVPALLTFLCLSASFTMEFAVIATVQFLVMVNSKNFTVPATTMLMGAIPQKSRVYYRRDMSVSCSLASTLVGVFLLLVRGVLTPSVLFLVAATLYLILAVVHFLLDKAYLLTLRRQIMNSDAAADVEQVASIRYLKRKDRVEQYQTLLESPEAKTRLLAIQEIGKLRWDQAEALLIQVLKKDGDSACVTQAARLLGREGKIKAFAAIREIIEMTGEARVKADLIESLVQLGKLEDAENLVLANLASDHHRVRASAVLTLLRITRQADRLELAVKNLAAMARNKVAMMRASAAAVMGELGLPMFLPCLEQLAFETNENVALSAVRAISRIQSPGALLSLERLKQHSQNLVANEAKKQAKKAARSEIEQINRLLSSISAQERIILANRMKSQRNDFGHELLATILCVEDMVTRKSLIELLEKSDEETLDVISRSLIVAGTQKVIFTLAPLFSFFIDEFCLELPDWTELLSILGQGTLENHNEDRYLQAGMQFLTALWAENLFRLTSDLNANQKNKLHKRTMVACQAFLCLSKDPSPLFVSLKQLNSENAYEVSMAIEFIENRIGKKFAELLPALLKHERSEKPCAEQWLSLGNSLGLAVNDNAVKAAAVRLNRHLGCQLERVEL
jgi:HEAT repeat protein